LELLIEFVQALDKLLERGVHQKARSLIMEFMKMGRDLRRAPTVRLAYATSERTMHRINSTFVRPLSPVSIMDR
jgi:hypothetical protein